MPLKEGSNRYIFWSRSAVNSQHCRMGDMGEPKVWQKSFAMGSQAIFGLKPLILNEHSKYKNNHQCKVDQHPLRVIIFTVELSSHPQLIKGNG